MDGSKVLAFVAVATVVNEIARIREGKEAISPIIGSAVLLTFLMIIGTLWRWDIVTAMAALFLISSLLIKGVPTIQAVSKLVEGAR